MFLFGTIPNEKRAFPDKWKIASRHYAVNGAFILHGSVNRPQNEQPFHIIVATDYGHTMAKSLILWVPNSNPNKIQQNIYLGLGYKGIVFCRNNGWTTQNMNKGPTVPK